MADQLGILKGGPPASGSPGYKPVDPTAGKSKKDLTSSSNTDNQPIVGSAAVFGTPNDLTPAQALALLPTLDSKTIGNLQYTLYKGGFYGSTQKIPALGRFGPQDISALKTALTNGAIASTTALQTPGAPAFNFGNYLSTSAAQGLQNGFTTPRNVSGTDVVTVNYTNPNDIAGRVQSAFQNVLGRRAKDSELQGFVKEIHGAEYNSKVTPVQATRSANLADAKYAYDTQANDLNPAITDTSSSPGSDSINAIAQSSNIDPTALTAYLQALRGNESGNNYAWRSNAQGATGAYQILAKNYPGWARQAGVDPNDHSPAAQDKVAAFQVAQYYKKYGGRWDLVAAAWQGGQGTADKIARDPSYASRVGDVNESTQKYINNQMNAFSKVFQQLGGTNPTPKSANTRLLGTDQQTGTRPTVPTGVVPSASPNAFNPTDVLGVAPQLGPLEVGGVTGPTQDAAGIAEEVRKQHPVEAGTNDYVQTFHNILGMLGKAV